MHHARSVKRTSAIYQKLMNELIKRGVCIRPKRLCIPLHRRGIILIPNWPFWLLDSASIQPSAGDNWAAGAHALIFGQDGTF
jgi:hypothetical protein